MVRNFASLTLYLGMLSVHRSGAYDSVRLVTIVIGNNNPTMGYEILLSAIDVALVRAAVRHPAIVRTIIREDHTVTGQFQCEEAVSYTTALLHNLLGDKRTKKELTVVMAPGCSFEAVILGDFAREADVLLIASTASIAVLKNKQRFPTTLAMAAISFADAVQATSELLLRHRWNRVSVVCQRASADSVRGSSIGLEVLCKMFKEIFQSQAASLNFVFHLWDEDFPDSLLAALTEARIFSTVIICVTESSTVVQSTADELGMGNGEYVSRFPLGALDSITVPLLPQFFLILPWSGIYDKDQVILDQASKYPRSLDFSFMASFGNISWSAVEDDMGSIKVRALALYGYSFPYDMEMSLVVLSAYECTLMLAQVLSQTRSRSFSGKELAAEFFNRTFDLPSRPVTVGSDGVRVSNILFEQYHRKAKGLETVFTYHPPSKTLAANTQVTWTYPGFPPEVTPKCGFHGELCHSSGSGLFYLFLLVPVAAVGTALKAYYFRAQVHDSFGWHISDEDVSGASSTSSLGVLSRLHQFPGYSARRDLPPRFSSLSYKNQPTSVFQIHSTYGFADLVKFKAATACLDHDNVARFFGLYWPKTHGRMSFAGVTEVFVLSRQGERGFLNQLIQTQDLCFNWDLRFALISDILHGLGYIHRSNLRYHGMLQSGCITVNKHFTAAVDGTALDRISEILSKLPTKSYAKNANFPSKKADLFRTVSEDILQLGRILFEISTRRIMRPVNLPDIVQGSLPPSQRVPDIDESFVKDVPPEILAVIRMCCTPDSSKRPDVPKILRTLQTGLPRTKGGLIDKLTERLGHYNQELEETVRERQKNLLEEMQRLDLLLLEFLPKSIVQRLRKSEMIEPEFFDNVSVLFGGVPAFDEYILRSTPLKTVTKLDDLYSSMDKVLAKSDVYKVEHIASGVPVPNGNQHAYEIAKVASRLLDCAKSLHDRDDPIEKEHPALEMQIGINSGPCVTGVIGKKLPHYALFGDTINVASRMETTGAASMIQISASTRGLLNAYETFQVSPRGVINVKGKGQMETFWLSVIKHPTEQKPFCRLYDPL